MTSASRLLTLICVLLTGLLWAVTLITDPPAGPIMAAATLTAIVGLMMALTSWKWPVNLAIVRKPPEMDTPRGGG